HTRRPKASLRYDGRSSRRHAERTLLAWLPNEPPRRTRLLRSVISSITPSSPAALPFAPGGWLAKASWHQAQVLPCRSNSPGSLGRFWPTGHARSWLLLKNQAWRGNSSKVDP